MDLFIFSEILAYIFYIGKINMDVFPHMFDLVLATGVQYILVWLNIVL